LSLRKVLQQKHILHGLLIERTEAVRKAPLLLRVDFYELLSILPRFL
jgi:hypothetical protein